MKKTDTIKTIPTVQHRKLISHIMSRKAMEMGGAMRMRPNEIVEAAFLAAETILSVFAASGAITSEEIIEARLAAEEAGSKLTKKAKNDPAYMEEAVKQREGVAMIDKERAKIASKEDN